MAPFWTGWALGVLTVVIPIVWLARKFDGEDL